MAISNQMASAVAASTFIIQVVLVAIIKWGTSLNRDRYSTATPSRALTAVTLTSIVTVLLLMFTDGYYAVWSPILGQRELWTFPVRTALAVLFFWDVGVFAVLIRRSGGAKASPFTPALFLIPALAIFLRVPILLFLTYSALCGVLYWVLSTKLYTGEASVNGEDLSLGAHRFVNLACLALATIIGLITAPAPV